MATINLSDEMIFTLLDALYLAMSNEISDVTYAKRQQFDEADAMLRELLTFGEVGLIPNETDKNIKVIESLTRLNNSVNGNPRYLVHFTDGSSAKTKSDASLGYAIANPEYRDKPLEVVFTRSGNIESLTPYRKESK